MVGLAIAMLQGLPSQPALAIPTDQRGVCPNGITACSTTYGDPPTNASRGVHGVTLFAPSSTPSYEASYVGTPLRQTLASGGCMPGTSTVHSSGIPAMNSWNSQQWGPTCEHAPSPTSLLVGGFPTQGQPPGQVNFVQQTPSGSALERTPSLGAQPRAPFVPSKGAFCGKVNVGEPTGHATKLRSGLDMCPA